MTLTAPARRRLRRAAAALAAASALALGACQGQQAPAATTPAAASSLPAAEGTVQYPMQLDTPFGSTTLDHRPERIAVITGNTIDVDAVMALGATPVFAPTTIERNPWLDPAKVAGIESTWKWESGTEVSAEAVAATKPDLIVALTALDTFDAARFTQLSAIAPVAYAHFGDLSWQEVTRSVAKALDLVAAGEAAISHVDDVVDEARAANPQFEGRTAAHVIAYDREDGPAYRSTPGSDQAELFERLGFVLPPAAAKFEGSDVISDELIPLIEADFLLVTTFKGDTSSYFVDSPLYQSVPAVAEGRVVVNKADETTGINSFAWGLGNESALSVPWLIDELAAYGAQAIPRS